MKIADAMNTYNIALKIIIDKGFSVSIVDDDMDSFEWEAKKEKDTFIASDPLRLLGLIEIGEKYGERWNEQKIPDHYHLILEEKYGEQDI